MVVQELARHEKEELMLLPSSKKKMLPHQFLMNYPANLIEPLRPIAMMMMHEHLARRSFAKIRI
jgi:hypothetical protein